MNSGDDEDDNDDDDDDLLPSLSNNCRFTLCVNGILLLVQIHNLLWH